MSERIAVGVDLGGTNLRIGLVARSGKLIGACRCDTEASMGPQRVSERIAERVRSLLDEQGIDRSDVDGLTIASPGPMSVTDGIIHDAANLPGWKDVPVRQLLADLTGMSAILENDANAAAFGEYWMGAGRGARNLVTLTFGTGIGGGAVVEGVLLRGQFENASELGHMIVVPGGRVCTCGQLGCFEQYASASAIARNCEERIRGGAQSSLAKSFERRGSLDAEAVANAARSGDALAVQVWDEACRLIAIGCVNIQHALNPERIILAGGMAGAGDLLLSAVKRHFAEAYWNLLDDGPQFVIGELGDHAGVIGAAGLVWERAAVA